MFCFSRSVTCTLPFPFTLYRIAYSSPIKPSTLFLSPQSSPTPMSSEPQNESDSNSMEKTHLPEDPKTPLLSSYPTPLSPPSPPISKQIELSRAMTASSRSSLFALSRVDVIFEDQWLLVVNKPSGVYCESVLSSAPHLLPQSGEPKWLLVVNKPSGLYCESILSSAPHRLQQSGDSTGALEVHLANRLDRDTSGVMVITKSHKVAAKLVQAFTDHKVQKTYVALCIGSTPKWDRIRLKSGHGRSKFGAWRVYAASDVGRTLPGGSTVRDMETLYEILSVNGQVCSAEAPDYSKGREKTIVVEEKALLDTNQKKDEILVRAFPKSGRTHQIRLHCQYLGIPIKGDVKYEGVCDWKGESCDGHALHAESLAFEHPVTGLPVVFSAPQPLWASQAIQS